MDLLSDRLLATKIGVGIGIGIGIETKLRDIMGFGHEKLDVYQVAIEYVGWAYRYYPPRH